MSHYFTDSYSVLALGWGLEMVWAHEWALLQCQHNWISEIQDSHRPHNKPGHGFISYWFKALLEMPPCSPVQFPLIYIHNLRICNPVAKFQPALNRKYSESGNTPAINYFRSQTHVVHWQVDSSGDSSHLITHLKNTIKWHRLCFCVLFLCLWPLELACPCLYFQFRRRNIQNKIQRRFKKKKPLLANYVSKFFFCFRAS